MNTVVRSCLLPREAKNTRRRRGNSRPTTSASGQYDIAGRMDRLPLSRLHLVILATCACGFTFDILEITLGSGLSTIFSSGAHRMDSARLSWLISAVYVGAIVGAPALGWIADRVGRKAVLMAALLWVAFASIALAARDSLGWLLTFRFMAGLALGAYPPLMMAYLTDVLPPSQRGRLILILCAVSALGPMSGLLLLSWLTPLHPFGIDAWRWLFVLGGIGAACGGALFRWIPESPRWLSAIGKPLLAQSAFQRFERSSALWVSAVKPPIRLASPYRGKASAGGGTAATSGQPTSHRRYLFLGAALYFLSPWATTAFPLLSGPVFLEKGIKLSATLLYLAISTVGQLAGAVLAATFADRIQRRDAIVLCAAVMALAALTFALSFTPFWLAVSNFTFSVAAGLFLPALAVYVAELFPTGTRGSASATTWSLNRLGAVLALLILVPMLQGHGVTAIFSIIAVTLAAGIALIVLYGPRGRAGQAID